MSDLLGNSGSNQNKETTTASTKDTKPTSTPTDPKVIAAYVCFGVGAFIIIVAVVVIIIFLVVRRRRERKKKELQRSLCLDDYKFPGSGYQLPISTISGNDRLPQAECPDYNFTGNGYHFPLTLSADDDNSSSGGRKSQRHPVDDDDDGGGVTSHPVRLSKLGRQSLDSSSTRPSGSSGADSQLADTDDGYVRLHRSSPLAGINAIYGSSGELGSDGSRRTVAAGVDRTRGSVESRAKREAKKGLDRRGGGEGGEGGERGGGGGSTKGKFRHLFGGINGGGGGGGGGGRGGGVVNEGFVVDEDYENPAAIARGVSVRWSAGAAQRTRLPVTRSSGGGRRHSILLDNVSTGDGVYHVSLRHDGSAVTQTRVVKHPT